MKDIIILLIIISFCLKLLNLICDNEEVGAISFHILMSLFLDVVIFSCIIHI